MSERTITKTVGNHTVERARQQAAEADRVIVKAGTNSLTDDHSQLDRGKLDKLASDIMDLRKQGKEVLLVSSGAIGAGKGMLDAEETETLKESQALSTLGQSHLMRYYTQSFDQYDQKVAQILLTERDLTDPERFTNVRNTVETLFEWGIIPIVNENDAIATEEIQIGDNDMLSASIAIGLDIDLLVTLTDVGGVYTGNPKHNSDAELIETVGTNYDAVQSLVAENTTAEFGGILTKVEGARDVSEYGIPAIIADSATRNVLERIVTNKAVGTLFIPMNGGNDD